MRNEYSPDPALLAEGEGLPLIPRMYEVQSAEELMEQRGRAQAEPPSHAPAVAEAEAVAVPEPPQVATEPLEEGGMPFVGRIVEYEPGVSISVERTLSLAEDLYLADHTFVHAPGVKPVSACLPVMPMTMSLEVMAEVAACLAPGLGLIGLENVKATRWIELVDAETLVLHVAAKLDGVDVERNTWRVSVAVRGADQSAPAISGQVLFAPQYRLDLLPDFTELANPRRLSLGGEGMYEERHLFHGPRFHCLTGDIVVADSGGVSELLVKSPSSLFRSVRQPQLLLDPALLDGVGQFMAVWAMQNDRYVYPIGFRKLELYRTTPPVGSRVPLRVEIVRDEAKTLYADVEIQDGAGGVWMRISEWGNWKFRWERQLVDFRRMPTRYLLSRPVWLAALPSSAHCRIVANADVTGVDTKLLARNYLHRDEMAVFEAKGAVPQRQKQWMLGRVAAKDAVRAWHAARTGAAEMLHPASFVIDNDEVGQPAVRLIDDVAGIPRVSISHSEDRAVAVADLNPVGIDVEAIRPRDAGFVDTICTAAESELLADLAGREESDMRAEWITRFWCAKEATGKLFGTGVDGAPQRFEAIAADPGGDIGIQVRGSDALTGVHTARDGDFIIACAATDPAP